MRFNLGKDKLMYLGQSCFVVGGGTLESRTCQKMLRKSNPGEMHPERDTRGYVQSQLPVSSSVFLEWSTFECVQQQTPFEGKGVLSLYMKGVRR